MAQTTPTHANNWVLGSCVAAATLVLGYSAWKHLHTVREDTRVTDSPSPQLINQRTEDAIKIKTLGTLYDSPNYDIRQAAVKLVVERVLRSNAYSLLLFQVRSSRRDVHTPALQSLRFLTTASPVALPAPTVDTCAAVVVFLGRANRLAARRAHAPHTDWRARGPAEQHALVVLNTLCAARPTDALAAGVVPKWLANYPFGGAGATEARRREVVRSLLAHATDDECLAGILVLLINTAEGRKQMRAARLIGSVIEEKELGWHEEEDYAGYVSSRGQRRHRAESEGEIATRRRHRQAMVFSEGGGPVTRDNIYENESIMSPTWSRDIDDGRLPE